MAKTISELNLERQSQQKETISIGSTNFLSRFTDFYDDFVHAHDFYELVYISYGDIKHCVDDKTYPMRSGDAFLIVPGKKHHFIRKGECAHRDIMFSEKLFKIACEYVGENFYEHIINEKFLPFTMSTAQMEYFENSYFLYDMSEDLNVKDAYARMLACQLLGILYANTYATPQVTGFKSKCLTIINEHFTEKNVLEILREELGYTQGHLCKKFKATFSMTPTDYVNTKRIQDAAARLTLSNFTVEECCYVVGFESLPHFIKLFKEHYGTTPAKYRKTQKTLAQIKNNE